MILACLLFSTGHAELPYYYDIFYVKRTNDTEKNTYYLESPEGTFVRMDREANSVKLYEFFESGTREITITETTYFNDSNKDSLSRKNSNFLDSLKKQGLDLTDMFSLYEGFDHRLKQKCVILLSYELVPYIWKEEKLFKITILWNNDILELLTFFPKPTPKQKEKTSL